MHVLMNIIIIVPSAILDFISMELLVIPHALVDTLQTQLHLLAINAHIFVMTVVV